VPTFHKHLSTFIKSEFNEVFMGTLCLSVCLSSVCAITLERFNFLNFCPQKLGEEFKGEAKLEMGFKGLTLQGFP